MKGFGLMSIRIDALPSYPLNTRISIESARILSKTKGI